MSQTSRLEFEIADAGQALAALDREPDFEQDETGKAVWLDLDIPALDGMTPREAAKNRRMRPRLKALLMQTENRQARLSGGGQARDTAWLWKERGLRRP